MVLRDVGEGDSALNGRRRWPPNHRYFFYGTVLLAASRRHRDVVRLTTAGAKLDEDSARLRVRPVC